MKIPEIRHFNLDMHPAVFAALLADWGLAEPEAIFIRRETGTERAQIREISSCKVLKDGASIQISAQGKRDFIPSLEAEDAVEAATESVIAALEPEWGCFQLTLRRMELAHALDVSELQKHFLSIPSDLDWPRRQMLAYFLPFVKVIRGDVRLIRSCLQVAIGQRVLIKPTEPEQEIIAGPRIGHWISGTQATVGGLAHSRATWVMIRIGPVPPGEAITLLSGGEDRRVLEQVLLPNFLPPNWRWKICLQLSADEGSAVQQPVRKSNPRIGMNAILQET